MTRTIDPLPNDVRVVLIARNPRAGARNREVLVQRLTEQLEAHGLDVECVTDLDVLKARLRDVAHSPLRAVIAAGGDGTVSTVANCSTAETPIAIFPLGTENLLAKYLEISCDPQQVARAVATGATVRLDAGRANGKLFLLMVGCGFDADVVHRTHGRRQGHIRRWTYVKPILESIRSYQYHKLRIYCDSLNQTPLDQPSDSGTDRPATDKPIVARWAFVINLPCYAGGLKFVPSATATDGLLDVCLFQRGALLHGLRYLAGVVTGRHLGWSDVIARPARTIRIESDMPATYQLDGDPGGPLPVEIRVLPDRLRMIVTQTWAEQHGFQPTNQTPHSTP